MHLTTAPQASWRIQDGKTSLEQYEYASQVKVGLLRRPHISGRLLRTGALLRLALASEYADRAQKAVTIECVTRAAGVLLMICIQGWLAGWLSLYFVSCLMNN